MWKSSFAPHRFWRALDDVDGDAHRGPDVVVVDARRHHVDEDIARAELGHRQRFLLEGVARLAEALGADHLREHLRRERRRARARRRARTGHSWALSDGGRHHALIYSKHCGLDRKSHGDLACVAPARRSEPASPGRTGFSGYYRLREPLVLALARAHRGAAADVPLQRRGPAAVRVPAVLLAAARVRAPGLGVLLDRYVRTKS